MAKIREIGLSVKPEIRQKINSLGMLGKGKYKLNYEMFENIERPEIAYLLGLLWADGTIRYARHGHCISIMSKKSDLDQIIDVFKISGNWSMKVVRKNKLRITCHDHRVFHLLEKNDYRDKSKLSPDKILALVPDALRGYWFRGYCDGDGHVSYNRWCISFTSSRSQDWRFLWKYFPDLKWKYRINLRTGEHGQVVGNSTMRINNKSNYLTLCDYMYAGYVSDKIGFSRKYANHIMRKNKDVSKAWGKAKLRDK
jgi:hypothetical protein